MKSDDIHFHSIHGQDLALFPLPHGEMIGGVLYSFVKCVMSRVGYMTQLCVCKVLTGTNLRVKQPV